MRASHTRCASLGGAAAVRATMHCGFAAMWMWMDGRRLGNGPAILWPDDVVGLEADIISFLRRTSYPTLTGEDGMAELT